MQTLTEAQVTREHGVANDFRGRPGKRQVTVMSGEAWRKACAELGSVLPWTTRRANLLVEGIELPRKAGGILRIGPVALQIHMEVDPCSRMEEQCPGLRDALVPNWRGGVACSVLEEGEIRVGDPVSLEEPAD